MAKCPHGKAAGHIRVPIHESNLCILCSLIISSEATVFTTVEDSTEAAVGAGLVAGLLERSGGRFVRRVGADMDQEGAEAEMFVHLHGDPNVILRLHVTEVKPRG